MPTIKKSNRPLIPPSFCTTAISAIFFFSCNIVQAQSFTYEGNISDLKTPPTGAPGGNAFYAGTNTTPISTGGKVSINYDPTNTSLSSPSNVFGGIGLGMDASANQVSFLNGKASSVYGGWSNTANATGNHVTVNNGTISNLYGGSSTSGKSLGNIVVINGGTISNLYAGYTGASGSDVSNNRVIVNGGTVSSRVWGGSSISGNIYNNSIEINSGQIGNWVYGGWSTSGGSVTNNTIVINGGNFTATSGFIGGGVVYSTGKATDNTIAITNSINMPTYALLGGRTWGTGDAFSGNRLIIKAASINIKSTENFEFYDFYIPSNAAVGNTLLNIAASANITNAHIEVKGITPGKALAIGDSFTLINAGTINGTASLVDSTVTQDISLIYDVNIEQNGNTITATIVKSANSRSFSLPARINPQTKALSEGRIAGLAFTIQGADLVSDTAIKNALVNTQNNNNQLMAFGVAAASDSRYKSGSHVDVDGYSLLAGAAYKYQSLLVGGFIEGGWGNYDSYNSFNNAANVHGEGDTKYYGAGLLGRYNFDDAFYADASIRIGRSDTDFKSHDLISSAGIMGKYDSKSDYYSMHIGAGYLFSLNTQTRLDMSAKYLWTHLKSDHVNVAGDPIHFTSADSHRARFSGQLLHDINPQVTFMAGLGYEYEFNGDADATTYQHYKIDSPSIGGSTGIGELGISFTPTNSQRLTLDAMIKGYVGKREGVAGTLQLSYAF